MRDAFVAELLRRAQLDESIMLVVGDLGYGVVDSFASQLPRQFLNAGVAEQNMVGMAAGLASAGHRVFVYSIANFPTLRCLEQVRNDVCYHGHNVTIVSVGAGVSYGTLGYTHHAVEDIAIMRCLPNMRVISPADPLEATAAVGESLAHGGPTYVRLGKNGEPKLHETGIGLSLDTPITLRQGRDLVILGTGAVVGPCLEAASALATEGVNATVLSCPTIRPFDAHTLLQLGAVIPVLTVEEHVREGGFGSAVMEAANDAGVPLRIRRLGLNRAYLRGMGSSDHLRSLHGLDAPSIHRAARDFMETKSVS